MAVDGHIGFKPESTPVSLIRIAFRLAVRAFRGGTERLVSALAGVVGRAEASRVTKIFDRGELNPLGPRVAVFCHWDRRGRIAEHVRKYVIALHAEGLSIVLVSNAEYLETEDLVWAESICVRIIVRRNLGFDFGAWREGLEACALPRPDTTQIILVNDSMYGPFWSLAPIFRQVEQRDVLWGLTDSWQRRYHLQSYFLVAGPAVFRSRAWRMFWEGVLPVRSKSYVIRHYEIGLTQFLLRSGIECDAIWPYEKIIDAVRNGESADDPSLLMNPLESRSIEARSRILKAMAGRNAVNPTAELWSALLELGFPFLKRELIRLNPGRVPDTAMWRPLLQTLAPSEVEIVRRDLMLNMRNRSP